MAGEPERDLSFLGLLLRLREAERDLDFLREAERDLERRFLRPPLLLLDRERERFRLPDRLRTTPRRQPPAAPLLRTVATRSCDPSRNAI